LSPVLLLQHQFVLLTAPSILLHIPASPLFSRHFSALQLTNNTRSFPFSSLSGPKDHTLSAALKLLAGPGAAEQHIQVYSPSAIPNINNFLKIYTEMDPFSQTFTLLDSSGHPFNVSMADIASLNYDNVQMALIYGVQIGLTVVMLVTLLLLTQPGKRQSPVFILNVLALLLNTTRASLLAVYLTSNWDNPYSILAADYSRITNTDVANSIAVSVVKFVEVVVIEISLVLQVHVVLSTATRVQRFWLMVLSGTVGMIAIAFQLGTTAINSVALKGYKTSNGIVPPDQARVASAANITLTISICFFMAIFISKLGYALKQRRTLGLHKFGPMQVIFIMGLQTMIVPCKRTRHLTTFSL
jgi:pheromone alpha factor receptor